MPMGIEIFKIYEGFLFFSILFPRVDWTKVIIILTYSNDDTVLLSVEALLSLYYICESGWVKEFRTPWMMAFLHALPHYEYKVRKRYH